MKLQLSQCLWALAVCFFAATASAAQQVSASELQAGTITGTALDVTGGAIPGATILLQGQTQGDERRAVTLDDGSFKLEGLKPGTVYHVTVSAPGFAQWTSPEIVLTPGQYFLLTGINLRVASVQVTVNVVPNEEVALQQMKAEEQQRIVGLIPNFYVAYEQNTVPLTSKMKFRLATRFATDPVTMAGFVVNAAIYQMSAYPSYQQGAKGYGQRLGATFAGGYTNIFVGDAILPSLLHQDPRYFYQGTGTKKSRLLHALSTAVVIRGDNGRREINFSDIGGDLASGAIANAYYPNKDRGAGLVFSSALIGTGGRAASALFEEFLLHKFTSRHSNDGH